MAKGKALRGSCYRFDLSSLNPMPVACTASHTGSETAQSPIMPDHRKAEQLFKEAGRGQQSKEPTAFQISAVFPVKRHLSNDISAL